MSMIMTPERLDYLCTAMNMTPELLVYLSATLTGERLDRIETVLSRRTRRITVVLEDIYHPPNAGAVIRTCECLGIQDLYVIRRNKQFTVSTDVVRGAAQWVTLNRYEKDENSTAACIADLKERGYKLAATTLRAGRKLLTPDELPANERIALCLGEEENGLSDQIHDAADYWVRIPMYGFTQSYNISVSAALCLQPLMRKLRDGATPWQLDEQEKSRLRAEWICNSVKHLNQLVERFNTDNR